MHIILYIVYTSISTSNTYTSYTADAAILYYYKVKSIKEQPAISNIYCTMDSCRSLPSTSLLINRELCLVNFDAFKEISEISFPESSASR